MTFPEFQLPEEPVVPARGLSPTDQLRARARDTRLYEYINLFEVWDYSGFASRERFLNPAPPHLQIRTRCFWEDFTHFVSSFLRRVNTFQH